MHMRCFRKIFELHKIFIEPLPVGMFFDDFVFNFFVSNDTAFLRINKEHTAWLQPPLLEHTLRSYLQNTHFRSHDHKVVLGHVITGGTKTITVQNRTNLNTICKDNRSRTVPRFHQARVVFIESLFIIAHTLMIGPGFRDHHHDCMRKRTPAENQEFQTVIKHRRVAAVRRNHRKQLFDIVAEKL